MAATPSILSELGQVAIEQRRGFHTLLSEAGIEATNYQPFPVSPRICFIHVPKTGGASVARWMEGMFAKSDIAPAKSVVDFERIFSLGTPYEYYAGHIVGKQLEFLPPETQLFTILRDPLQVAISGYYRLRETTEETYELDRSKMPGKDALRGDDARIKTLNVDLGALFREIDLPTALALDDPRARLVFRDLLLRIFGAAGTEDEEGSLLAADAPTLQVIRERQLFRARDLLDRVSIVGDYHDLESATLLLAATRGWPAPPRLPRLHDIGAPTTAVSEQPLVAKQFAGLSPFDSRVYDYARQRAIGNRDELARICGASTGEAVNAHHVKRFFSTTSPVLGFTVTGDDAWNGRGWGIRQWDGNGSTYRQIADTISASTLVSLESTARDYRVFVHVFNASGTDVLQSLTATVQGTPLRRAAMSWRSQALIIEWQLPSATIDATGGQIEITFETGLTSEHKLWIAHIGCVPAPV